MAPTRPLTSPGLHRHDYYLIMCSLGVALRLTNGGVSPLSGSTWTSNGTTTSFRLAPAYDFIEGRIVCIFSSTAPSVGIKTASTASLPVESI
jgi:hypothetical protein